MRLTRRFLILSMVALVLSFPVTAFLCGTERWSVKIGKDAKARLLFRDDSISTHELKPAVETTLQHLRTFEVPGPLGLHTPRFDSEAETTVWTVDATLFEYKEEKGAHGDTDYHLALRDDSGRTMIAEIPKTSCLSHVPQPLRSMIRQARVDFDAKFTVTGSFKFTTTRVRITGPGFFDFAHGQVGRAPNGIEIHPVIKIEFLN